MYKKISCFCLMFGFFITGCSQQQINAPDIQPVSTVMPKAIDTQIQDVITPKPIAPRPVMVKPVQRMVKPVQRRMPKPIQRPRLIKPVQRMMSKPIQRQYQY